MSHFWRLKMMLTWLAVATMTVLDASSLSAASPHAMRPERPADSPAVVRAGQDGSHLLLHLVVADVIDGRLKIARGDVRALLMEARIGYTGLAVSGRTLQVRITNPAQLEAAKTALKRVTDVAPDSRVQEMTLDSGKAGLLKFTLTDAGLKYQTSNAISQSIKVIKNRLQDLRVAGTVAQPADQDGILVQTSDIADRQTLEKILTRPGRLSFHLVDLSMPVNDAISGSPPVGSLVVYTQDDPPVPYLVENRVILSDKDVLDARPTYSGQQNDEPVVVFRFGAKGAARFKQVTTQNVGRPLAVILDDHVISAPVIREPIDGGYGQVSGNFTVREANTIAMLLRTGPLPARLTIAEEAR
ncbi:MULTISPECIES: hypothetical protein [unclassified Mesorhizobium]|uniref:SecDF P1 head subdomain-containing protein n=2 Tax=unclassified Mesorhizobium TaxID=325217 RepID=UPI0011264CCF|nr:MULTISPECIES: hypothetical protein [unclassified Mesorhizobium]TPL52540.1 hypothetical protein FJ937_09720 [Mesorhizobium sp. B2-4-4]